MQKIKRIPGKEEALLTYKIMTNRGSREINEDYAGMAKEGEHYCFLLADGLGGHGKGEVASELVVETGKSLFGQYKEADFLDKCFQTAQDNLLLEQRKQNLQSEMKTTMVVLEMTENTIQWGHVGDSRLYLFQKGKLVKRTLDHSVPQMLVMAGEIKEKQIRGHEDRNRLLRVMGTEWSGPQYVLSEKQQRMPKQAFLLCSDGFWELIDEKTMQQLLKKSQSVEEWMERMSEEVRKNGTGQNMDNYTAIAVWND